MAPNYLDLVSAHTKRASDGIPSCVTACMSQGNTDGCSGISDYACICLSSTYVNSVATCMSAACNTDEIALGEAYANAACAYYVGNGTSTDTASNSTGTAVLTEPVLYSSAYVNIQAVMSSICGALLICALIMGFQSCRQRYRREQAISQNRTWTGVGSTTLGGDTKQSKSRFFNRTNHSSAFDHSRNATGTFMSDNFGVTSSNFGGTTTLGTVGQSFGGAYAGGSRSGSGSGAGAGVYGGAGKVERGFTNRMNRSEEWEMETKGGESHGKIDEEDEGQVESPTTSTKMGSEVEVGLDGSTVHLNRLDKEGGSHAL
ncbi:hypothetical protein IAT38_005287 [Cryptococcus sp. DSM 104549]